jgi:hypothetical protein
LAAGGVVGGWRGGSTGERACGRVVGAFGGAGSSFSSFLLLLSQKGGVAEAKKRPCLPAPILRRAWMSSLSGAWGAAAFVDGRHSSGMGAHDHQL